MHQPTNAEILQWGTTVSTWVANINPVTGDVQEGEGVVNLILFEDAFYEVITGFNNSVILDANEIAVPYEKLKTLTTEERKYHPNIEDEY